LFEHDLFGKPVPTFPDHAQLRPNRIIEHLFAAITLIERTGKGSERAMANGMVFGGKLNLTHHQRLESIARRNAGESMTDIGRHIISAIAPSVDCDGETDFMKSG
jgi:hypothetical protein